MRLPLPREHGAWAMGILALAAGWGVGAGGNPWHAALATFVVVAALLAQAAWLDRLAPRWFWRIEALAALAAGAYLAWRMRIPFAAVGALVAGSGALAQALRSADQVGSRVRLAAFPAHLAGAVALAGCGALVLAARGVPLPWIAWAWIAQALGFAAGVGFVQAVQPGSRRSWRPLAGVALLAGAAIGASFHLGWEPGATAGALAPVLFRLAAVPALRKRGLSWKEAGWMETGLGIWSLAWMAGAGD